MTTYAVHFGDVHLARCNVDPRNFRSLQTAMRAAKAKARAGTR